MWYYRTIQEVLNCSEEDVPYIADMFPQEFRWSDASMAQIRRECKIAQEAVAMVKKNPDYILKLFVENGHTQEEALELAREAYPYAFPAQEQSV
jgi:hypothetical protein